MPGTNTFLEHFQAMDATERKFVINLEKKTQNNTAFGWLCLPCLDSSRSCPVHEGRLSLKVEVVIGTMILTFHGFYWTTRKVSPALRRNKPDPVCAITGYFVKSPSNLLHLDLHQCSPTCSQGGALCPLQEKRRVLPFQSSYTSDFM